MLTVGENPAAARDEGVPPAAGLAPLSPALVFVRFVVALRTEPSLSFPPSSCQIPDPAPGSKPDYFHISHT